MLQGFYANLCKNPNGTQNYYKWGKIILFNFIECGIPGPKDSPWEGGIYKINLEFPNDYPIVPPRCVFEKKLFHPNIYPSGAVCLSIINDEEDWRPSLKVKDILLGIQELLKNPNPLSPAQKEAYTTFTRSKKEYENKVREQARECTPKS